jgi:hypothetical protein
MSLIQRYGRRATELSPHQKRLMFLLDTFHKKFPVVTATTLSALMRVAPQYVTWERDPRRHNYEYLRAEILRRKGTRRAPMDRWGRWVFEQVRWCQRARPLPWSRWTPQEELDFRAFSTRSRTEFSDDARLQEFLSGLGLIIEWVAHGHGRPSGHWKKVHNRARAWHAAALAVQVSEMERMTGLQAGTKLGDLKKGWTLIQLTSRAALKAEGATLHHCVGSYWAEVSNGQLSIYSLRKDGVPKVTFSVRPDGSIEQAKGPHNVGLGLLRNARYVGDAKDFKALGEVADLETLSVALQAVSQQGWTGVESAHDMRGCQRVLELLAEAAEASTKKRGQRAAEPPPRALSYRDARELFKRADPKKGVVILEQFYLVREVRNGTTIYVLRRKRFSAQDRRTDVTRTVPEDWRTPWGPGRSATEGARRRHKEEPHDSVEIWPDRWVVYSSARHNEFWGMKYTPLTHMYFDWNCRPLDGRWIGFKPNSGVVPRVPRAHAPPTWSLWPISCPVADAQIKITVSRAGVPMGVECLDPLVWTPAGANKWLTRRRTRRGSVYAGKYRVAGAPGTNFKDDE